MAEIKTKKDGKYIGAVGRRKTAVARVRIFENSKNEFVINDKDIKEYFPTEELRDMAKDALVKTKNDSKFSVTTVVKGGGISAQAEAIRHGIARALISSDEELKSKIKKAGFLKRDSRMKERKKFGLKKARKAPQWSKR